MGSKITLTEIWGLYFPTVITFLMMAVWFVAFFSPGKEVVIGINYFGEAWVELIAIPIAVVMAVIGQIRLCARVKSYDEKVEKLEKAERMKV